MKIGIIGAPYAGNMTGENKNTNLGEFEQASQRLLLELALEASSRELTQLAQTAKPQPILRKPPASRQPILQSMAA